MLPRIADNLWQWRSEYQDWHDRGVTQLYGFGLEAAFDSFSMARGILNFSRDLRKYPETIARAAEEMTDSYVFLLKNLDRFFGVGRVVIALHRTSNDFISPDTFEKVALPSLKSLVERLKAAGVNSILHCDGNWDLNLEALRELPAGCCVAQFDGASNIFKAKKTIGDRMCIYGDVPADLLALGSPTEVDEYCHRLIEEVGKGGGFILGSGCELAPNARPENVKAMMESVVKYGYYS
jgi:uroporphyrinogen-III decarboxylase